MNLGDILSGSAASAGDRIALSCEDRTITYGELDAMVTRLAGGLQRRGIRKGDRVALHMGNTIEMAASYFACFRIGAVAVPINVRLKPAEIEYVLSHSEASLCLDESTAFAHLLAAPVYPLPSVQGSDPAVILYTSGTTARPKGVTHSHDSTRCGAEGTIAAGYRKGDVLLGYAPMAHIGGLMLVLVPAIILGSECALVPRFDAGAVLRTIERRRCTAMFGLPAHLQAFCREMSERPVDASTLRTVLAGGDSVSVSLQHEFRRCFGVGIQEGIGMTECVPICMTGPGRIREGSIGERGKDVEVRIVDASGAPVARGAVGELVFRAPAMTIGYWNDAAATSATIRDGWLYSGDLAREDDDGYFWFAGRKKEVIIRGGSNIAPQEVEEALLQHPAVFQAGVVGMPDADQGESVVAFVSLRERSACGERELIEFARRFLSDHKVPGKVHFLPNLPLGATGKVSRKSLRESLSA